MVEVEEVPVAPADNPVLGLGRRSSVADPVEGVVENSGRDSGRAGATLHERGRVGRRGGHGVELVLWEK